MRSFKKIFAILLSLILLASSLCISFVNVAAEEVEETLFEANFQGAVESTGLVSGWTGDTAHWEVKADGSNQKMYYKGSGSGGATLTSTTAFDIKKYDGIRIYLSIGVLEGQTINGSNDLKLALSDGDGFSYIFNLSTNDKYDIFSKGNGSLVSYWFNTSKKDSYYPTKGLDKVTVRLLAKGNVAFSVDDIRVTAFTEKPDSSSSSGSTSGSTTESSGTTESGNKSITKINVNLSEPKVNTTQPTQVSGTGFTGTISWTPSEVFVGGTQYVANITLKAASGYEFSKDTTITLPSADPTNIKITSNEITFNVTYIPEATTIKVTKISYDYVTRTTARLVMETSGSDTILEQYFEYGTSIGAYTGKSLDGNLTDLSSNTIYYYRAVVVTASGQVMSEASSFKTASGITIVTKASSGGTVTPFGTSEVATGDNLTVTVTPNEGYVINFVTVDEEDVELAEDGTYTFTNIGEDHVLYAAFKPETNAAGTEKTGGSGLVKFLIIFLAIILALAILIFLMKPKGMGFGDLIANFIIKIRRWNYRRKQSKGSKPSRRSTMVDDDEYYDDEYGYDDDDFDEDLPVLGQSSQNDGFGDFDSSVGSSSSSYDDDFSKKYDFDRFK